MLSFLRELLELIIFWTLSIIIFFGIPGFVLAVSAIVLDVKPGSGTWVLLLLLIGGVWLSMLMNPPLWLERIIKWVE